MGEINIRSIGEKGQRGQTPEKSILFSVTLGKTLSYIIISATAYINKYANNGSTDTGCTLPTFTISDMSK